MKRAEGHDPLQSFH